ncbi:imidazole glycerol phosphate synthase subunit HisH [Armatimonadetes bacterium Uphvl-Ar1]|nr:imidazole glycerol phosphate synthase subunit HisH [Armatimonadetes bacterium Uphvl-Ar1]
MGNLRSVENACRKLGHEVVIQSDLSGAERLILPGVGAFGQAMNHLSGLKSDLQAFAKSGQPLLGICLGQQLLLDTSEEFGAHSGLEIIPGKVQYFPKTPGVKIPQMGWNRLDSVPGKFTETTGSEEVYFVHSLYTEVEDESHVAAWTNYGIRFASALQMGNVWATQFHPEKSGEAGLRLLERFLTCS